MLFPNGSYIKESHHTSLHCSRDANVLYILCITTKCVKLQQNYFSKKGTKSTKKRQEYTRSKKIFKNSSTKY